jgi:hypothetical protein
MIPFFVFLKTRVQEFAIKNLVPLPFVFPNPTATIARDNSFGVQSNPVIPLHSNI